MAEVISSDVASSSEANADSCALEGAAAPPAAVTARSDSGGEGGGDTFGCGRTTSGGEAKSRRSAGAASAGSSRRVAISASRATFSLSASLPRHRGSAASAARAPTGRAGLVSAPIALATSGRLPSRSASCDVSALMATCARVRSVCARLASGRPSACASSSSNAFRSSPKLSFSSSCGEAEAVASRTAMRSSANVLVATMISSSTSLASHHTANNSSGGAVGGGGGGGALGCSGSGGGSIEALPRADFPPCRQPLAFVIVPPGEVGCGLSDVFAFVGSSEERPKSMPERRPRKPRLGGRPSLGVFLRPIALRRSRNGPSRHRWRACLC
mmetsp:Transcript_52080/g.116965  ORF Transcript_52080/g.116965 Transcript_52080/m.116965 type:complete len:329 (-) Transcript_52080:28-1014(-)